MKFALPKYMQYCLGFLAFMFLLFGWYFLFFILLLVTVLLLFFSRLTPPHYQQDLAYKDGIFYSPVNGQVSSVDGNSVTVVIPWWRSFGIYLPMKSEIKNVIYNEGNDHFRYFPIKKSPESLTNVKYAMVSFLSDLGEFSLNFVKCPAGQLPYFQVMAGDRGKALVMIGHFVLGGTVIINLPQEFNVKIKEKVKLSAGETILASR